MARELRQRSARVDLKQASPLTILPSFSFNLTLVMSVCPFPKSTSTPREEKGMVFTVLEMGPAL